MMVVRSSLSSLWVTEMLRLPPKQALLEFRLFTTTTGERLRGSDCERNLAAVSPNSAIEVIVVSSKRTVRRGFGVFVSDPGADAVEVLELRFDKIPRLRWPMITSSSLSYVVCLWCRLSRRTWAPKRSLNMALLNSLEGCGILGDPEELSGLYFSDRFDEFDFRAGMAMP